MLPNVGNPSLLFGEGWIVYGGWSGFLLASFLQQYNGNFFRFMIANELCASMNGVVR